MATPIPKDRSLPPPPAEPTGGERSEPREAGDVPSPEVLEQPTRRSFTAEYKRRILAECDAASGQGLIGQILRREGLWSSHLRDWRVARERAERASLEPKARGPKPRRVTAEQMEVRRLERENARLVKKLERAELIIDFQKKVSALLGIALPVLESSESDGGDS